MTFQVYWKLVGRHGQTLDRGGIDDAFSTYGDATAAFSELLKSYPEVHHSTAEGYWLARRSADAHLAIWLWIERSERRAPQQRSSHALAS